MPECLKKKTSRQAEGAFLKIGIYLEQYQCGGVDSHLASLLKAWPNASDKFILITNKDNDGLRHYGPIYQKLNVKTFIFQSVSYVSVLNFLQSLPLGKYLRFGLYPFLPLFFLLQYLQGLRILRSAQIDFLIADNGAYPGAWGALAAVLASKRLRIKSLLIVHHNATPYQVLRKMFEKAVDRRISSSAVTIAVSQATLQTILKVRTAFKLMDKTSFIHNGTDIESPIEPCVPLENFRREHPNKKVIGIVGRVEAYKGHEDLIRGLALLPEAIREQLIAVFVGSYTEAEKDRLLKIAFEIGIEKNIFILGFVQGSSKSIISYLDLLMVLTRDFEGFGLSLIEAMAVEVPTLATNVGAIPEFISHEENGYIIPPCDPKAIAQALHLFVSEEDKWLSRAQVAKKNINLFSEKTMAQKYYNLIQDINNGS